MAEYLRVSQEKVVFFVKKRRLAKYVRIVRRRYAETEVIWVTRSGARLVLEHFRALQGKAALKGRDWYADEARRKERARAALNKRAATAARP